MRQWLRDKDLIIQKLFLIVIDVLTVITASAMALWVRYDFSIANIDTKYLEYIWSVMLPNVLLTLFIYWMFKLYRSVWKYAGIYELQNIVLITIIKSFY